MDIISQNTKKLNFLKIAVVGRKSNIDEIEIFILKNAFVDASTH